MFEIPIYRINKKTARSPTGAPCSRESTRRCDESHFPEDEPRLAFATTVVNGAGVDGILLTEVLPSKPDPVLAGSRQFDQGR